MRVQRALSPTALTNIPGGALFVYFRNGRRTFGLSARVSGVAEVFFLELSPLDDMNGRPTIRRLGWNDTTAGAVFSNDFEIVPVLPDGLSDATLQVADFKPGRLIVTEREGYLMATDGDTRAIVNITTGEIGTPAAILPKLAYDAWTITRPVSNSTETIFSFRVPHLVPVSPP